MPFLLVNGPASHGRLLNKPLPEIARQTVRNRRFEQWGEGSVCTVGEWGTMGAAVACDGQPGHESRGSRTDYADGCVWRKMVMCAYVIN